MDLGLQEGPTAARWLAWATAVLLAVAGVSVGVVNARAPGSDTGVVSAAGGAPGTVDVASTTTVASQPPVTLAPPSTVARSTTVPKAAAAVLAAIASTVPPTTQRPPAATTTSPPVTSTTAPTTSTTSTTAPGRATVTLANEYPDAIVVTVNGRRFDLAISAGPIDVVLVPSGNDVVEVRSVVDPSCGTSRAGGLFPPGGSYRLAVVAAVGRCGNGTVPRFDLVVTVAPR